MFRTILVILMIANLRSGAQTIDQDFTISDASQIGLSVWSHGVLGNSYSLINGEIYPSCQFRQSPISLQNQVEHLSDAAIWIGGSVNSQFRVSTAMIDGAHELGDEGIEFRATANLSIRSSDQNASNYDPDAVSDQDIILNFKDYGVNSSDNFGILDHQPLGIDVHLEIYSWNRSYAEGLILLKYTVTNSATDTIYNPYAGIWVDASVANMNHTSIYEPTGGFTWYDNLCGYDQSFSNSGFQREIGYSYDDDGDDGWAESYLGISLLGGSVPIPHYNTFYNQWKWNGFFNPTYPSYVAAQNDVERYEQLSTSVPRGFDAQYTTEGYPNFPASWVFMISAGPLGSHTLSSDSSQWVLPPGESFDVIFSVLAGEWSEWGSDSPSRRTVLTTFSDRAQKIYNGEDVNRNNLLDAGEDKDGDNVIDRFILPADPPAGLSADWAYPNVTITWDPPEQTISGYNVYKNNILLTQTPIAATTYLDNAVVDSGFTNYNLTSINSWGFESAFSNNVRDYSQPPRIWFLPGSNPQLTDLISDTSYTFPTRTFLWTLQDPDGNETVESIYYSVDDTTTWIELNPNARDITLNNLQEGIHTFFLKARDETGLYSSTIRFPDPEDPSVALLWKVKPVIGQVLLVDDYPMDSQNNSQSWYQAILDTIPAVGSGNYSVWEIGESLPYSAIDITSTLEYFDHVIWYSAATGVETYDDAESSITSYVMNGGNIFLNITDFRDNLTFGWFPVDSLISLNPSGRLYAGRTLVSQVSPALNLQTSGLISTRLKGFETFLENNDNCPEFSSLYRMQEPDATDEWSGTPNVCGTYRFQSDDGDCSGNVVLMSIPMHSSNNPLLDGNGSAGKFLSYLFTDEFLVGVQEEINAMPKDFQLYPNYPNPFNPSTTLLYELAADSYISLIIYDTLGKEVIRLISKFQRAGIYNISWDGTDRDGKYISAGVYFARLQIRDNSSVVKMVYLR